MVMKHRLFVLIYFLVKVNCQWLCDKGHMEAVQGKQHNNSNGQLSVSDIIYNMLYNIQYSI